eukprot:6193700-Pleurochrysis_carterae.AAC.3
MDASFATLDYSHTPQLGYQRLFGTFHAKVNPHFDSKDVKSGHKFVRHQGVTRTDIKVYHVITSPSALATGTCTSWHLRCGCFTPFALSYLLCLPSCPPRTPLPT